MTDRKPFAHGVPHLHLLWRREGSKLGMTGASVEEVEHGLICNDASGRGLGHLYIIDSQIDAAPDFETMLSDRLTYVDLRVWLLAVRLRADKDGMI